MEVVVAQRAVLAVQVVGDDEHDRRLPDGGHVERLVEGADVGGAVTEERERARWACSCILKARPHRPRSAARRPRWRWRRCCPCEVSMRCIEPPTPLEPPVDATHQLREGGLRASCPGPAPRRGRGRCWSGRRPGCMAAIDADRDRFLALAQVGRALDLAAHEQLLDLLLEEPDADHRRVPVAAASRRGASRDRSSVWSSVRALGVTRGSSFDTASVASVPGFVCRDPRGASHRGIRARPESNPFRKALC